MTRPRAARQAWVVLRKELTDAVRDRRALWSIGVSVVLGPLLAGMMMTAVAGRLREPDELRIPVVGMAHAPALMAWLARQDGVRVVPGPARPEVAVRTRAEDLVLVVPSDFVERFNESRPVAVRIVTDSSRRESAPAVDRVRRLLEAYNAEISALRLIARGVSPTAMAPLRLEQVEVSTAQQRAAQVLAFIPMFILMAGFAGGMQIATDSTAGERERGSFEPLLLNPAPRSALVVGKWLAAAAVAMLTSTATTALCLSLPRFVPLGDLGIRFTLGTTLLLGIAAAVLPLCLLSSALQLAIATLARSFKEAQTYMGLLLLVPTVPGMVHALYPFGVQDWMYLVPVWGPYTLLMAVMGNDPPGVLAFAGTAATSSLCALACVRLTTGLFRSERIIFSR